MKPNGTKKKTDETKRKKASRSKTVSVSSKTPTASSKNKNAKAKPASSSQEKQGVKSLRSSSRGARQAVALSQHGQPHAKNAAPTWDDEGWETKGWSKPRRITPEEHTELSKMFDEKGKPRIRIIGRPKKPVEEKLNSKPFRISARFEKAFKAMAVENGFKSWQEWLRVLGAKEAGLPLEAN